MKKYLPHLIVLFILLIPIFLFAQSGPGIRTTIDNPIGTDSVQALLLKIMNLVAVVGAIVVVFMIIYSGYTIVMARGNEAALEKGKDMLLATVIGGAILLGADVIANVVVNTVNSTVR